MKVVSRFTYNEVSNPFVLYTFTILQSNFQVKYFSVDLHTADSFLSSYFVCGGRGRNGDERKVTEIRVKAFE